MALSASGPLKPLINKRFRITAGLLANDCRVLEYLNIR